MFCKVGVIPISREYAVFGLSCWKEDGELGPTPTGNRNRSHGGKGQSVLDLLNRGVQFTLQRASSIPTISP